MPPVDWVPLVSTAVGAAVALIGTLLADVLRSRGDHDRDVRTDRRRAYVEFLLALNAAHARLREIGDPQRVAQDLSRETSGAFSENHVYEGRELMLISADRSVLRYGEKAFEALVQMRKGVRDGIKTRTPEYHLIYHRYAEAVWRLRRAIREDLGGSDLTPGDVEKSSWDGPENCEFCRKRLAVALDERPATS